MFKQSFQLSTSQGKISKPTRPSSHPCDMGAEEPSGAEFSSERDEGSDQRPSRESLVSRRVHSLQLAVNDLREKIQQLTVILQRVMRSEESLRNLERAALLD